LKSKIFKKNHNVLNKDRNSRRESGNWKKMPEIHGNFSFEKIPRREFFQYKTQKFFPGASPPRTPLLPPYHTHFSFSNPQLSKKVGLEFPPGIGNLPGNFLKKPGIPVPSGNRVCCWTDIEAENPKIFSPRFSVLDFIIFTRFFGGKGITLICSEVMEEKMHIKYKYNVGDMNI
jgi:hypothetical protein